jgi:hypothetical protein
MRNIARSTGWLDASMSEEINQAIQSMPGQGEIFHANSRHLAIKQEPRRFPN